MSGIAITAADIALYRRYDGDADGLSRSGDRNVSVSDAAWRAIEDLRQRAFIVAAGRGSPAFEQEFEADLAACIPDAQVRSDFQRLVEADVTVAARREGHARTAPAGAPVRSIARRGETDTQEPYMPAILYSGTKNASSWAFRAWLALKESGLPFEERVVDIRRPQRYANLAKIAEFSPPGAVPVLVDGEWVIFDSLAIMEYANEACGGKLLPPDIHRRARARSLLAWVHSGMSGLCSGISFESVFAGPHPPVTPDVETQIQKVAAILERELSGSSGPYLAGPLSLADLAFVPVVLRLRSRNPDLSEWPGYSAWQERLLSRPSVREWMAEAEALPPVVD